MDHCADINGLVTEGNTELMVAVRGGCLHNVSRQIELLKEKNGCLNVQNQEGKTALMVAVTESSPESSPEIVELLVKAGVDLNIKDNYGCTALMHATTRRPGLWTEILSTLVEAGSDVNSQNHNGLSPLMLAASNCWEDAITILLDSGADVNAVSKNDSTKTALSYLTDWKYHSSDFKCCLRAFIKQGACLSYSYPGTIHKRIRENEIKIVLQMIQGGVGPADVETKSVVKDIVDCNAIHYVSPLCVALLVGNVSLARDFDNNMFLTNSDLTSLTGNQVLRSVLERKTFQVCLTFLDELSSQPMPLVKLAFVSVSSAVGSSPGRANRVNMLPLPQIMKNHLLFKFLYTTFVP